jgi:hypothetical protein
LEFSCVWIADWVNGILLFLRWNVFVDLNIFILDRRIGGLDFGRIWIVRVINKWLFISRLIRLFANNELIICCEINLDIYFNLYLFIIQQNIDITI